MNNITNRLQKALNVIDGLTEFELDRSEKVALIEFIPLFESSYALLIALESILEIIALDDVQLNKLNNLINYAKSGLKDENKI